MTQTGRFPRTTRWPHPTALNEAGADRPARRLVSTVAVACDKRLFFQRFLRFVPSLSWQNDRLKIEMGQQKGRFERTVMSFPCGYATMKFSSSERADIPDQSSSASLDIPQPWKSAENADRLSTVLFLRLSRACLGKLISFV
jgi:hypothetical protein